MESLSHYSNSGNGHGDGNTHETAASGSDNNDERRRSGGDDNASRPMMMMQGGPALSAEEMMRQQQHQQQQQHHHQHQLPMASSGLQFQQYMTAQSSAEMNNAAQLLAAARMTGNFR
eukprot:scaffold775_cov95-Skeletonema_marinoi.AAC.1